MKTHIKNLFTRPGVALGEAWLLRALIASLGLIPAGRVTAQTFTTLHSFTYSDGANPRAGLITNASGNTLYGTAAYGGSSGNGTVFAINTDGTGFTNLHNFTEGRVVAYLLTNSDGAYPYAGLILSGSSLYGTTWQGNTNGLGTVFAVNTNGAGFTNLLFFDYSVGAFPQAGLILSGNTLYSTAGTVFAVNTDGTGPTNLHVNSAAALLFSGTTLYGTAAGGGSSGNGMVFAVNTNGTGFTNLHSFTPLSAPYYQGGTNSDGADPEAGLILSGNTLYGTARYGGSSAQGTVFAVNTDGNGFTNLHSFTALNNSTNSDGASPQAGLLISGNTLYGTASGGGSSGNGTVFAVNTDGTGFTSLHSFTALSVPYSGTNSDGAYPLAGLVLSGHTLYGTAQQGGSSDWGTVFSISFRPQLTITPSGTNVILSWPTNVAGFDYTGYTLQSAPALTGTFTNLPAATNPYTNPLAGPQQFYRLSQ